MGKLLSGDTIHQTDWKKRNEAIAAKVREHLATVPRGVVLTTTELSLAIAEPADAKKVGSVLTRLARVVFGPGLCSHDGEAFIAYGKANKRWNWHGQKQKTVQFVAEVGKSIVPGTLRRVEAQALDQCDRCEHGFPKERIINGLCDVCRAHSE